MTQPPIACEHCCAKLEVFSTADGYVVLEREPNALGEYAIVGRFAVLLVPGWQPASIADGTVHESEARGMAVRFRTHRCGDSVVPPEDLVKTRPERPKNIRRGGR